MHFIMPIPTGIMLPGVNDDGQLWKALKALIPIHVCLSLLYYHNVVALSLCRLPLPCINSTFDL